MATAPPSAADILRGLRERAPMASWRTPSDLTRISIESFAGERVAGRQQVSTGRLRLAGAPVSSSTAPVADVAEVLSQFQKLTTAVGGALEGFKGLRGQFNASVLSRTKLRMAAPLTGSLIIQMVPDMSPDRELSPDGQPSLPMESDDQLVDRSVETIINLFEAVDTVTGEEFLQSVSILGPRVAGTVRTLAKSLSDAGFDTDLGWMRPGQPSVYTEISHATAERIVGLVRAAKLDEEAVRLIGVLHTMSDVASWLIELDGGERVTVQRVDGMTVTELKDYPVGSRVSIDALMTVERLPGGADKISYQAISVSRDDVGVTHD